MGAFLGALGGALAKGAIKAGKSIGQQAKNNLKQQFGGKGKQDGGQQQQQPPSKQSHFAADIVGSKKKGGPVKKTGVYLLHKNEYVVPAKRGSNKKASQKKTVIKA